MRFFFFFFFFGARAPCSVLYSFVLLSAPTRLRQLLDRPVGRVHRHSRPWHTLVALDAMRRSQGRLLRKASHPDHRRGHRSDEDGPRHQNDLPGRHPAAATSPGSSASPPNWSVTAGSAGSAASAPASAATPSARPCPRRRCRPGSIGTSGSGRRRRWITSGSTRAATPARALQSAGGTTTRAARSPTRALHNDMRSGPWAWTWPHAGRVQGHQAAGTAQQLRLPSDLRGDLHYQGGVNWCAAATARTACASRARTANGSVVGGIRASDPP